METGTLPNLSFCLDLKGNNLVDEDDPTNTNGYLENE